MRNYFWFRRDLRLEDNAGLYHALKNSETVYPVFIFDTDILDLLKNEDDARVNFIHQHITRLKQELNAVGSDLKVFYGKPAEIWKSLLDTEAGDVYTNKDYEPYAIQRDETIATIVEAKGYQFRAFKDHVIFEVGEILKSDGSPYVVYTPYSKVWKSKFQEVDVEPYPSTELSHKYSPMKSEPMLSLESMGFKPTSVEFPPIEIKRGIIKNYHTTRDFPAVNGTSKLSVHLRFGTVSIRQKAIAAQKISEKWLNELIWREFYISILAHFPRIVHESFKTKYEAIEWRNNEEEYTAWCQGKTGYPIVDAGMRQLNETGWMHNRVRMIVASFLTKHLLIDWRWGEAYFAEKLIDYELASNNGGWQWAAGCGVDAAPYFRVFNPHIQLKKFDKDLIYIKEWVHEYGTANYPSEIVDHKLARERCLATYKEALN